MHHLYELHNQPFKIFASENLTFQPHLHQELEMIYVCDGSMLIQQDGEAHLLNRGDMAIFFPNTVHSYEPKSLVHTWLFVVSLDELGEIKHILQKNEPSNAIVRAEDMPLDIPAIFGKLLEDDGTMSTMLFKAYTQLLVQLSLENMELIKKRIDYEGAALKLILNHINHHYQENLTLENIAKDLGMSRTTVSNTMNHGTGQSLKDYIHNLRISLAKRYLRESEMSILEVGLECGYESIRTFNRVFKQYVGVTPSEYRT